MGWTRRLAGAGVVLLALLTMTPARAETLAFKAELGGHKAPTDTGSEATGRARVVVDTEARTVAVVLDVEGIGLDDLWGKLVRAPIGPIHLHRYATRDLSEPDKSILVFPLPMGPGYAATAKGFHVEATARPYAEGAALTGSTLPFEDLVASLREGRIVINIHTDGAWDGEISGALGPE